MNMRRQSQFPGAELNGKRCPISTYLVIRGVEVLGIGIAPGWNLVVWRPFCDRSRDSSVSHDYRVVRRDTALLGKLLVEEAKTEGSETEIFG